MDQYCHEPGWSGQSTVQTKTTRAASTSAANRLGVPPLEILRTAGWIEEATFQKYYNKPLSFQQNNLADTLLQKS